MILGFRSEVVLILEVCPWLPDPIALIPEPGLLIPDPWSHPFDPTLPRCRFLDVTQRFVEELCNIQKTAVRETTLIPDPTYLVTTLAHRLLFQYFDKRCPWILWFLRWSLLILTFLYPWRKFSLGKHEVTHKIRLVFSQQCDKKWDDNFSSFCERENTEYF